MKRVSLLASICLVLAITVTACQLIAPTPDPAEIERLVAEAVQATIAAMPTATPYPTYTPAPLAPTYTPSAHIYTPSPTHTGTVVPNTPGSQAGSTFLTHIVVAGDTLSGLAREYGTTVEAIMEANELSDAGLIIVGQVLSIPVEEAGPASTPTTPISPTLTATSVPPTAVPTETPTP
jgi:LysM repeat protein